MEKPRAGSRGQIESTDTRDRTRKKKTELAVQAAPLGEPSVAAPLKVKGHHYDAKTIQQALTLWLSCGTSFRGAQQAFEVFQPLQSAKTPDFTSIRNWLGRVGLYELKRKKDHRDDWIFIVDLTLELGKQKALVVLGISQSDLMQQVAGKAGGLRHQDVELLGLEVMDSTPGLRIEEKLKQIAQQVGVPLQIVADHGSDLACGIKRYQQHHPGLIYTHDVTHAMALLLKRQLGGDERYQSFTQACTLSRQRLQQTEFAFLAPPAQRSQCRYFNVERLTDWGLNLLNASAEVLIELVPNLPPAQITQTLREKMGWVVAYEADLQRWHHMVTLTRHVETHLKHFGLSDQSLSTVKMPLLAAHDPALQGFQQQIEAYLTTQCASLPEQQTFLASSDVIESLFGKYKQVSARRPVKEMGQMLLSLCLSTIHLSPDFVKKALETVRFAEVEAWLSQVLGQSNLSKRKNLFSA